VLAASATKHSSEATSYEPAAFVTRNCESNMAVDRLMIVP
jgi:hypothetical protein